MGKSQRQRIAENIQREELANELRRIIKHSKTIKDDKRELKLCYNQWCNINKETIETLTALKDKILTVSTVTNVAATVASITEIFGGVLCIAGAVADKKNLIETGNKVSYGGNIINRMNMEFKDFVLEELCDRAKNDFDNNKKYSAKFEKQRYSYFQQLESFKGELRTPEASSSLPLLLETAQRQGIDLLGDLNLDESAKSELRTNLRRMCRSNSKKIKVTAQTDGTKGFGSVFAREIRGLLLEFKELLEEDEILSSAFSGQTKKFLGENINSLVPYLNTAESYLEPYSGKELLQTSVSILRMAASSNRTEVAIMNGVSVILSVDDLIKRINDLSNGSRSKVSEELVEQIEEMKIMRENIIKEMWKIFGWQEPHSARLYSRPALEY